MEDDDWIEIICYMFIVTAIPDWPEWNAITIVSCLDLRLRCLFHEAGGDAVDGGGGVPSDDFGRNSCSNRLWSRHLGPPTSPNSSLKLPILGAEMDAAASTSILIAEGFLFLPGSRGCRPD